jgi:DNA-binding response OmpR family regulator/anti-sigma regulatory factor (Ser/Thr protein kinase)
MLALIWYDGAMERGTILIIDDNTLILTLLRDLLQPQGYQMLYATSGAEGIALANVNPPDLILLDVMMPDMNGFAVCQHVRIQPNLAQVPIMMITALDDRASRMRGFEAGADDFITKPFDSAELRARVATVIRLNRYRRLLEEQARAVAERTRFEWVVEESDDGFVIVGADDTIRYTNPRARHYLNLSAQHQATTFLATATRHYRQIPAEAWADWPAPPNQERFLVQPVLQNGAEFWLRVDILRIATSDDESVIRLRDVTDQITSQRDMWTFHAMLTHKLRTPLVSILGGLNLLVEQNTTYNTEATRRIAQIALQGARRLQGEIEDILSYLRGPANTYGSDAWTCADLPMISSTLAQLTGVHLDTVTIDPDLAQIRPNLAQRSFTVILRELFTNAHKFHPQQQPTMTIRVIPAASDRITIEVCDDGIHLTPEQLARAWRPYYQVEKSFTGQADGMGLGLALVARIVHAVNGTVALANRSDQPGLCVTMTFPHALDPQQHMNY